MILFRNEDAAYRAWVLANLDGFVLNTERIPARHYLKLHRANCPHVTDWLERNPTSTGYVKACSLRVRELAEWASEATVGGSLDPCRTCRPDPHGVLAGPWPSPLPGPVVGRLSREDLLARFAAAVEELDHHFEGDPGRLGDDGAEAEMRRWLDGEGPPLDWAGPGVTTDEWFLITTLYGQRTRAQQRALIRGYFPRFVGDARRDIRLLTMEVMRDWDLDHDWMRPRLARMGWILRERGSTMQGYVDHLRRLEAEATPDNPMPALDAIVHDHQANGWKTLSVFVRDCVGGRCFPIDSRVRKELERHGLPSAIDEERLLVGLCLALGRNPRQVARMFYEAGGVGGDFSA